MEIEEQSDQTKEIVESGPEPVDTMTVPVNENPGQYPESHITNNSKTQFDDVEGLDSRGSEIYKEANDLRNDAKRQNSYIAMETKEGHTRDLGEDGEILEDGEIASDQEGELKDIEDDDQKQKSSPSKSKGDHHDEERDRKGKRKDRHSKRRRSREDGHRDKQTKKKRHREYGDYEKSGDDYEQNWSGGEKRDKNDKKGNRSSPSGFQSPAHDSHGEDHGKSDKDHRRGSGDRHHSTGSKDKHRRDRDHDSDRKGKERSPKDRHEKRERSERKDRERQSRNSRDSKEKERKNNHLSDGYESPPGIYDSPSDDETNDNGFSGPKLAPLMSFVESQYMDTSMGPVGNGPPFQENKNKNKKKQQKRKEWLERKQQRERDMEEDKPPKKKPLLQTPMEERPQCRFFKEGKCQKGSDCPFNHSFRPEKRLEVCKYYVQSTCWSQGECVFMHEEFPCKYFHTGSTCYQGDNCKFSHDPLTEETRMALDNAFADRDIDDLDDRMDRMDNKKHKKKGLLGDQPPLSEEDLHRKLQDMKRIPSIFDIETHAPGESPRKPPSQSPSMIRPQGIFPDNNASPGHGGSGGPNMNFQGNRPPFMPGPGGPGMDGPPPGMQGPPMGGPGFMGPPGMGPGGPPGPGMQGAPLGPPMNNQMSPAAAIVGALLRAAPMLQQYRGPGPQGPPVSGAQGPPTSMPNNMEPRFGSPAIMGLDQSMGTMTSLNKSGNNDPSQDNQANQDLDLSSQNFGQLKQGSRDPRKGTSHGAPSVNDDDDAMDTDMRDLGDVDLRGQGHNMGDVDLRQDIDMRHDDKGKQGDTTPQQEWDDDKPSIKVEESGDDDLDIPEHLPPKQREMFLRIKQMSMKIKKDQSIAKQNSLDPSASDSSKKAEDDKWYSSDEEDDIKRDTKMSLSHYQHEVKQEPDTFTPSSMSSSLNVMQMINAVKSTTPASQRLNDPRKQLNEQISAKSPPREPTVIHSREGDCPWRLVRVLYVKQKIPSIDLHDAKYKADPRVQKILKMQELECGKIIDHTKTSMQMDSPPIIEPKLPDLLDPKVFKQIAKPEIPLTDPRSSKKENADPRIKHDSGGAHKPPVNRPVDPRVQKQSGVHNIPNKPLDPRLARQESNSGVVKSGSRHLDPRLSGQSSSGSPSYTPNIPPLTTTAPLDPRMMSRQNSSDPRLSKNDTMPIEISASSNKPSDPRLSRVRGTDLGSSSLQRQYSHPGTREEREAASDQKTKIDYRNDPRFKRKHISDSNLSPTSSTKRFPEQRKTTTEYSSPLGGESSQSKDSGYNSYQRQRVSKPLNLPKLNDSVPMPTDEISTNDILDSLQIMSPPVIEKPDKNLKDIFKTIDPTASPFC